MSSYSKVNVRFFVVSGIDTRHFSTLHSGTAVHRDIPSVYDLLLYFCLQSTGTGTQTGVSRYVPFPYICKAVSRTCGVNDAVCLPGMSDGSLFFNNNATAIETAFGAYAVVYMPGAAVGADGNRRHFGCVVGAAFCRASL